MLPYAPWFSWVLPIAGALVTLILGKLHTDVKDYVAVVSVGLSALFSFSMIPDVLAGNIVDLRVSWFYLEFGVLVDPLSVLMVSVVNGVGFLVAIFSMEYMRRDPNLTRYWFLIQIFIGGLDLTVVADNLLWLFIGWEIVGVSCAALVAFWHQDPYKAHCGLKTFMVLRVGDALLLTSILMIYAYSGTFNFTDLQQDTGWMLELSKSNLLLVTSILLFGGALAKSALFPLHEWLPDALPASPASFNALTEVLAGAFLVARFLPIFHGALVNGCSELYFFFSAVAWLGAFTALLAALLAMVQRSIIRVLVYSIISQYAYVMVSLGVGGLMKNPAPGYLAANMHLMIDAISSALLFLSAASLLYATGSEDMFDMGRIREKMPITFKCMTVGALALMGIPPLSAFWSEEAISGTVLEMVREAIGQGQHSLAISGLGLYLLLMVTTAVTAFFTVRMMGLIFGGAEREGVSEAKAVNEVPAAMWIPMAITAIATVMIGLLAPFIILGFRGYFSPLLPWGAVHGGSGDIIREALFSQGTVATGVVLLAGILPAYPLYVTRRIDPVKLTGESRLLKRVHDFLSNRCYIDALYYKIAYGMIKISQVAYKYMEMEGIEKLEFSGFNEVFHDVTRWVVALSQWAYPRIELGGFDAFNYRFAGHVASLSEKFRGTHTGILSYNMLAVLFGIVLLAILLLLFGALFPGVLV